MARFTYADTYNITLKVFDEVLEEKSKDHNNYYHLASAFTINLEDKDNYDITQSFRNSFTKATHFHLPKKVIKRHAEEYSKGSTKALTTIVNKLVKYAVEL